MDINDRDTAFSASPNNPGQMQSREAYARFTAMYGDAEIFKDYLTLRRRLEKAGYKRMDWRKVLWLIWDGMNLEARELAGWPTSQKAFCVDVLAVSPRSVQNWSNNKRLIEAAGLRPVSKLMRHRDNFFDALIDGAKAAGDDPRFFPHLRMALEMTEDYTPSSKLKHQGGDEGDEPIVIKHDLSGAPFEALVNIALGPPAPDGDEEETAVYDETDGE